MYWPEVFTDMINDFKWAAGLLNFNLQVWKSANRKRGWVIIRAMFRTWHYAWKKLLKRRSQISWPWSFSRIFFKFSFKENFDSYLNQFGFNFAFKVKYKGFEKSLVLVGVPKVIVDQRYPTTRLVLTVKRSCMQSTRGRSFLNCKCCRISSRIVSMWHR